MPGGIHPPPEVILSWPKPNYQNPQTQPKFVLVLACILGPLTIFFLLARLYVRIRLQRNAGLDDWLMLASIVPVIALTIVFPLVTEKYHFNRHIWDVDPTYFPIQRKYVLVIETVFCVGSGLIKISILLFYRRISSRAISTGFRWATWITIGSIVIFSIIFTFMPIFLCSPISAFWDQTDVFKAAKGYKYKCLNEGADVFAAGVISAVQDLVTAMLPTFLYWNLQIPFRQKVALFGIFAIGYFVVGIGAMRAYASWQIFFETYDVTWVAAHNWLWTMLELHIGAMCANAPALKVFFVQFLRLDKLSARSRSRSNNVSGQQSGGNSSSGKGSGPSTKPSFTETLMFWRYGRYHSSKGYLSEPHTNVSVDLHGAIRKETEMSVRVQKNSSPNVTTDSIDIVLDQHDSDRDIEMGSLQSGAPSVDDSEKGLQALPHVSEATHPQPPQAAMFAKHKNGAKGLTPFPISSSNSKSKGTSAWGAWN